MKTILLTCLAPVVLLFACTAPHRAALASDGTPNSRAEGCCGSDCEMTAECRPDGTCVITCTTSEGGRREIEIDCDTACGAGACDPASCDVSVECLSDGRARVTCEAADGSTCEKVVECCTDEARPAGA